jgi:hypothetical protein
MKFAELFEGVAVFGSAATEEAVAPGVRGDAEDFSDAVPLELGGPQPPSFADAEDGGEGPFLVSGGVLTLGVAPRSVPGGIPGFGDADERQFAGLREFDGALDEGVAFVLFRDSC